MSIIAAFAGKAVAKVLPFKYWILGGLMAFFVVVISAQCINNKRLHSIIGDKEAEIRDNQVKYALSQAVIEAQRDDMQTLDKLVQSCQEQNAKIEANSAQAIANLQEDLADSKENVREKTIIVKEALANETCANVAIPSDVVRVLRNGATRTD